MGSIRIMLTLPGAQSAPEGLNEKKQRKKSQPSSSKVSRSRVRCHALKRRKLTRSRSLLSRRTSQSQARPSSP
jgi:hypothetical protein